MKTIAGFLISTTYCFLIVSLVYLSVGSAVEPEVVIRLGEPTIAEIVGSGPA